MTFRPSSWLGAGVLALLTHVLPGTSGAADWITTWGAAPQRLQAEGFVVENITPPTLTNRTIRQVVRVSIGGSRVRVVVSNEFGRDPLEIGGAGLARAGEGGAIVAGSGVGLKFAGGGAIRIPPGARVVSDPVCFDLKALENLAISLFLPHETPIGTIHREGRQAAFISQAGNFVDETVFEAADTNTARMLLSGVMVDAAPEAQAIVLFGDSITDGDGSTPDENRRYPDVLAERLQRQGHGDVAVVNAGISGARLLKDGMGDNALARLDRDVLAQPRVRTMVVQLGINDIGWAETVLDPAGPPPVEAMLDIYGMLIDRAHSHGIRVLGATITPFARSFDDLPDFRAFYSPEKDAMREEVNAWIRSSGAFDGVIDFDRVLRDPDRPDSLLDAYNSGDNLHPNDAGYKAMAESIDLDLLLGEPGRTR